MKITLIRELNPFFDASASGNRFASLVKGLHQEGANITILVTSGYGTQDEKKLFPPDSTFQGIRIIYLSLRMNDTLFKRRLNKYILGSIHEKILFTRLKKKLHYDIDILWITNNPSILSFYNRYASNTVPSFLEINEFHDIYKLAGNLTNKAQLKSAQKNEQEFLDALKKVDSFGIMTKTLLQYYQPQAKSTAQFLHLPMTVDLSRFNIEKDEGTTPYIAFAGSTSNYKDGLNILIESFSNLASQYPQLELHIAGFDHPDNVQQKEFIAQRGLEPRVKYLGLLKRDEIPPFLKNAQILALARPDSHQAQGGFPTKLGEYLATKNPVCVTSVGEIPDYLTDNISAFMAKPGDIAAFTNALTRALSDPVKTKEVGLNGYSIAYNHFNMDVQAKRLHEFLKSTL